MNSATTPRNVTLVRLIPVQSVAPNFGVSPRCLQLRKYLVPVSETAVITMPEEPVAVPRRKGRPRDASADERILAAAAELILKRGYDNMTVDEVAAVAKAGKATVYRRWAGKEDLAFAALAQLYTSEFPIPDTGSIVGDLRAAYVQGLEFANSDAGRAYLRMSVAESLRDERIGALYVGAHKAQEAAARTIFERGIARGELRPDFRIDLAVSQFGGLVVLYAVTGQRMPTVDEADDLIDLLLNGIRA